MSHYDQYRIVICPATEADAQLKLQYGRLRYPCFSADDPYVRLDHQRSLELDHFDQRPDTTYLMVTADGGRQPARLVSAVRLIPTLADYELEMDSYRYLTAGIDLPKAADTVEGSRWVGRSSRSQEGMISTGLLMLSLHQWARRQGVQQLIGTISTKSEQWLARRATAHDRHSAAYYSARDDLTILVSRIDLDQRFLEAGKALLVNGLAESHIADLGVLRQAA